MVFSVWGGAVLDIVAGGVAPSRPLPVQNLPFFESASEQATSDILRACPGAHRRAQAPHHLAGARPDSGGAGLCGLSACLCHCLLRPASCRARVLLRRLKGRWVQRRAEGEGLRPERWTERAHDTECVVEVVARAVMAKASTTIERVRVMPVGTQHE